MAKHTTEQYHLLKSQGVCPTCGDSPPEPGRVRCSQCLASCGAITSRRKARLRDEGLCATCGHRETGGKKLCSDCISKQVARVRMLKCERTKLGLCLQCGQDALTGFRFCEYHREDNKNRSRQFRQARLAAGLCDKCGIPNESGKASCDDCRLRDRIDSENKRRAAFALLGGCCACCGESCFYFLNIDHVNNDGHKDRQGGGTSDRICGKILRGTAAEFEYQLLCWNCNLAKAHYGGTCPHTWDTERRFDGPDFNRCVPALPGG